jgi:glycyl-tRNA synthetase beta chain
MQTNQKYFPVKNAAGGLLPHFITFSNIESSNPLSIQHGNERVVTPRLSDAEFFWKQDRKKTLEERLLTLSSIVFQEKLGTLADKTQRVVTLAEYIAGKLDENVELAKRAALLAKTDLMTEMVGEFGNLQGIMGRYYALADNEPAEVAWALEEQLSQTVRQPDAGQQDRPDSGYSGKNRYADRHIQRRPDSYRR